MSALLVVLCCLASVVSSVVWSYLGLQILLHVLPFLVLSWCCLVSTTTLVSSWLVLSSLVLSCIILSCLVLATLFVACLVRSYLVLFCFRLPCFNLGVVLC